MAKKQSKAEKRQSFNGNVKDLKIPSCGFYNLREKMTEEQVNYAESILQNNLTFVNAGSGTGKTTVGIASLKYLYDLGIINKVVYVFSACQEQALGFRPGSTEEKISDYLAPLYDALIEIDEMPEKALDPEHGWCKAVPSTFLRGSNFKNVGILLDEFQNYTRIEAKKSLTRIHDTCHAVVCGSMNQIDLKRPEESGFVATMELFKDYVDEFPIGYAELTKDFRGFISKVADKLPIK